MEAGFRIYACHRVVLDVEMPMAPAESAAITSFLSSINPPTIRGRCVASQTEEMTFGITPGSSSITSAMSEGFMRHRLFNAMESIAKMRSDAQHRKQTNCFGTAG